MASWKVAKGLFGGDLPGRVSQPVPGFLRLTVGLNGCEGMFKADKFYTGKQPCGTESKTAQRAVLWYHINIHLLIDMYCKYLRVYVYIYIWVCVCVKQACI